MAPYSPVEGMSQLSIDSTQQFTTALKQAFTESGDDLRVAAEKIVELVYSNKAINYSVVSTSLSSGLTDSSADARICSAYIVTAFAKKIEPQIEAFLAPLLVPLLEGYADKKMPVRPAAEEAANALVHALNKNAISVILPQLFQGLERGKKWQTKKGSLDLIASLCESSQQQIARSLPDIIPQITENMWDTRPEVKKAAHETMKQVCSTASNADIEPFIPALVSSIANPSEVSECVYKLSATTFVKTVEAPALAIMEPLLQRGLNESKTAIRRQTAVIIDNMCKLVEDPAEVQLFLPKLLPGLKKVIESTADPECRSVAERAYKTLFRAGGEVEVNEEETKVEFAAVLKSLQSNLSKQKLKLTEFAENYIAGIALYFIIVRNFDSKSWKQNFACLLEREVDATKATKLIEAFREECHRDNRIKSKDEEDEDDEGEDLCNCEFSLAYGGMILLNNARLRLKRGHRYGLCGPNGAGKSTLMRAIANGQLEGFPSKDQLKTVYVEHNLQASEAELSVVDFVFADPEFANIPRQEVTSVLASVGFTDAMQAQAVGTLSGGWKMKLELARAMLMHADILLLDEPTNHLDVANVAWLENYLTGLTNVTSMVVSHDSGFLDNVCTNIIHYENRKLRTYKGNLSEFVKIRPEAKAYYELESAAVAFKFPEPGFLADIKNKGKPIIRLTNCSYQYPGSKKPSINNISVTCALSSRIAVLGPNGAGKSTLIKMLTGEVEPTSGTVWKHPSMRFAYVAQHAFHHIEEHLDISANEYIQWRFQSGEDKELLSKDTRKLSEEEKKALKKVISFEGEKRVIEQVVSRRKFKKTYEYEVKWEKLPETENSWIERERLEKWGFEKVLQMVDDREAARANMQARPVTSIAVQKHLDNFGLAAEFGTHSRMRGLSGGQKVKVVLAAAMWQNPHILVLDEPTNYLDRDSLGALASAIKEFGGGVVMISHHREFTSALCQETWNVEAGHLAIEGQVPEDKTKIEQINEEETIDAFGNVQKTKIKRKLTRKEIKAKQKARKEAEKRGEYWSSSDDE